MVTYKEIQNYIKMNYGQSVKTCWIADMKEMHGIPKQVATNRINKDSKIYPCPEDKKKMITEAFKYYKMI